MTSGRSAVIRGFPEESSENYLKQHFDSRGYTIELGGIVRADEKEICVLFTSEEHCGRALIDQYHECQIEDGEYVELLISRCSRDMEMDLFPHIPRPTAVTGRKGSGPLGNTSSGRVFRGFNPSPATASAGTYSSPLIVGEQKAALDKLELKREEAARLEDCHTERKTAFSRYSDTDRAESVKEKDDDSEKHTKGASGGEFVSLRVRGFGPDTDEETAELFFENAERSGAGEFESFHWDEEKREAVIVLQPEVAHRVQENESLQLEGAKLQVRPLTPVPEEPEPVLTTIEVRGFKPGTTEDALSLYFESQRSGGGKVLEVKLLGGIALVTFEDPAVALRVSSRSDLVSRGVPLTVSLVLPGSREKHPPEVKSTILVKGFPQGTNEEQLMLFFENKKRAGGGKVKETRLDVSQGVAYVTFEDANVSQQVIEKYTTDGLEFRKTRLDVRLAPTMPAMPTMPADATSNTEEQNLEPVVVVEGIPLDINEEQLMLFLENPRRAWGALIKSVQIRPELQLAVITFEQMTDVDNVLKKNEVEFHGCKLTARLPKPSDFESTTTPTPTPQDDPNPCSVLVTGLQSGINEETLGLYFMNKRRCGGGKILDISILNRGRSALITFEKPEVAQRVLSRPTHNVSNVILHVSVPTSEDLQEQANAGTILEISGFHQETTQDALLYFFENPNRSGGGEVKHMKVVPAMNVARVTFKEAKDAQRVLSKDRLFLDGAQLEVRQYEEPESPPPTPKTPTKCLVKVRGMHRDTSRESFEDFFQNQRRSGGGDIKEVHVFDHERQTAIIEYCQEETAQRVLERRSLSAFGATLTLSPAKDEDFRPAPMSTVYVTGLGSDVTKDTLMFYFENTKRSGGGEVEDVKLDLDRHAAYVTFVKPEDAARVCKRSDLQLNKKSITAQLHHGARPKHNRNLDFDEDPLDDAEECFSAVDSCAITVGGVASSTQEGTLKLYFENRRRSGGGKIKKVFCDKDTGVYTITFDEAEAVSRVLKKNHNLEESRLDVQRLDQVQTQDIKGATYSDQVLVRGLTPDISRDRLLLHLEQLTGSGIVEMYFCLDPSIVLVQFERDIDFCHLWKHCCRFPLDGTMLGVEKSPVTLKLQVVNIADIRNDTLSMHFENNRRSGGCEDVHVEINRAEGYAILTCPNADVHSAILKKPQTIDGTELYVNVYCPALGFMPLGFDCRNPVRIPESVRIEVRDPSLVSFIWSSSVAKKQLDEILQPLQGCVDWSERGTSSDITVRCMLSRSDKRAAVLGRQWEDNIKTSMSQFLNLFAVKEVSTLNQVWTNVRGAIDNLDYSSEEVSLTIDDNACRVILLGYANKVDDVHREVALLVREEEAALERAAQTLTEKVKLRGVQLRALLAFKFPKKALDLWPKLKVSIKLSTDEEAVLEGLAKEIMDAKMMMYELLQQLVNQRRAMADLKLQLLASKETRAELVKVLNQKNIVAVWEADGQDLVVHAQTTEQLDIAFQIFDQEVDHVPIEIGETSRQALSTKSWNDLISDMLSQNQGQLLIVPAANFTSIEIACLHKSTTEIMEQIGRFLSQNTVLEQTVPLPTGPAKFIALYMEKELKAIEADYKSSLVEIEPVERLDGFEFRIKGNQNGLTNAQARLQSLVEKVVSQNHVINKPGLPKYFNSERGRHCLEGFEARYKVVVQTGDEQSEQSTSQLVKVSRPKPEKSYGPEEKCRVKDRNGPQVIVYKSDLTRHRVDIIVNAANKDLDHIGGLAKALADKGGPTIQKESRQFIARHGRLLDGQVAVTTSGNLPCRKLIHAVGPIYRDGLYDEDNLLYEVVYLCLEKASELKASTIALPAISTGVFHFPLLPATRIIVEAVNDYCKQQKNKNTLKEIHLIDNNTRTTDAFQRAIESIYGKPNCKYRGRQMQEPFSNASGDGGHRSTSQASFSPTSDPMALISADGVTVTMVKGAIATQKVDAIMNTTSSSLNLKAGAVSSSILKAAGDGLQVECQQNHPNGVKPGEVAITGGHGLQCQFVFHGSCPKWDGGKGGTEKALRALVADALKQANQKGLGSIAMPAIGTGNLRVPAGLAARAMYEEISLYSQRNAGKQTIKDVRFVVYDQDKPTLDAFTRELQSLSGGRAGSSAAAAQPASSTPAPPTATATTETPKHPRGKIFNPSSTNFYEEKEKQPNDSDWETIEPEEDVFGEVDITDNGQQQMYVGPILLQVQQGDITKETTDVIVNSSNKKLDLSLGAVSKAIASAGGADVLKDCKRLGGIKDLIAVTSAGNLPSKKILHVDAPHSFEEWRVVIKRCLEKADDLQLNSISFPALGTGQISASADEMASLMMDTIAKFCHKKPKYLNVVRVTIFQADMLNVFHKQMHKKGAKKGLMKAFKDLIFGSSEDEEEERVAGAGAKSKTRPNVKKPHPNQISFTIFGLSKDIIITVAKKLDEIAKSECQDKVIGGPDDSANSAFIKNLSEEQITKIKSLQGHYDVRITVEKGMRINRIRVQGSPTDLMAVIECIHNVFHEADSDNWKKREAELLKDQVQWEFLEADKWQAYSVEINALIEKSYREQKPEVTWKEQIAGGKVIDYKINFAAKRETITGKASPGVEVRRKDLTDDSIPIPTSWEVLKPGEHFRRYTLKPSDPEYKRVEAHWRSTLGGTAVNLAKIERIQNPNLYRRYLVHKELMDEVNPKGTQNELELWHGTAAPPIESINTQGFNRSYCGVNGVAYGNGVYFATQSSYSVGYAAPDGSGNRHMYLAKVLVGQHTQGKQGMKVPPPKDPSKPNILFDSVVNRPGNPSMYIVFSDTQAYPEYLLTFK